MALLRFTRGSGFGGAVVRFATWSEVAHVGMRLDDGRVLDACPGIGVSIRDAVDDETTCYYKVLAPKPNIDAAIWFARNQVGKAYDWGNIAGLFFHRDWHKDTAWECSELWAAAFDYGRWPLIRDSGRFNRITPRDLQLSPFLKRADSQPNG